METTDKSKDLDIFRRFPVHFLHGLVKKLAEKPGQTYDSRELADFIAYACKINDVYLVRTLLPYIDSSTHPLEAAFYQVCQDNNGELIELLLSSHKCDISAGINGAIMGDHFDLANRLIDLLPPPGKLDRVSYAICFKGNMELVGRLMAVAGTCALTYGFEGACKGHHVEVARMILKKDREDIYRNKNMYLYTACASGHIDLIQLVMEFYQDLDWNSALRGACKGGSILAMQFAIDHGATNLDHALSEAYQNENYRMIPSLLARGADANYLRNVWERPRDKI